MSWGTRLGHAVEVTVLVLAGAVVLGHVLGQPILLGYVTTGSMTGTIDPGQGFVAIPIQLAGPVHIGDVVTYKAQVLHHGKLTTHRVVGTRAGGFVTQGDANLVTDQQAGEPIVHRSQIASKALQIGGHVVVIPFLGTIVHATQGIFDALHRVVAAVVGPQTLSPTQLSMIVLAAVGGLYALGGDDDRRVRVRATHRETGIDGTLTLAAIVVLVVAAVTGAAFFGSGTTHVAMDSVAPANAGNGGVTAGTNATRNLTLANGGLLPVTAVVASDSRGVWVHRPLVGLGPGSTTAVPITFHAPSTPGRYRRSIRVQRYPAVLPSGVTLALFRVHPLAPLALDDVLLAVLAWAAGRRLLGPGRVRFRSRDGVGSTLDRVRRAIRSRDG